MPITRPSDKNKDNADWWRDMPDAELEGEIQRGEIPDGPTANNKQGAGQNKYDEEMKPTRNPT
jgi:hypothetical protein